MNAETGAGGGLRHPFTRAYYEPDVNGNVRVTSGDRSGTFRRDGSWIDGDLKECDPQLCVWLTARRPRTHHRLSAMESHGPTG